MYASDDATLMMERVTQRGGTACYLVVGSGDYGSHHSSLFDFDEDVLPRASDLIERFIRAQRTSL
jgi:aminobenzoyl-glutamate utilization protein A